jgi:hypothetical protein
MSRRLREFKDTIRYHETHSGFRNLKWRRIFNHLAAGGKKKKGRGKKTWRSIDELLNKSSSATLLKKSPSAPTPKTYMTLSLHPFQSTKGFEPKNRIHLKIFSFPPPAIATVNAHYEKYFSHQKFTKENYHFTLKGFHFHISKIVKQISYMPLTFCPNDDGVFCFQQKNGNCLHMNFIDDINAVVSERYLQYYGMSEKEDTKVKEFKTPSISRLPSIPTDCEEAYENLTSMFNIKDVVTSIRDGLFEGNDNVHASINVNVTEDGIYFTQIVWN